MQDRLVVTEFPESVEPLEPQEHQELKEIQVPQELLDAQERKEIMELLLLDVQEMLEPPVKTVSMVFLAQRENVEPTV